MAVVVTVCGVRGGLDLFTFFESGVCFSCFFCFFEGLWWSNFVLLGDVLSRKVT